MTTGHDSVQSPRTLLEQLIWERRQTLEEFAEYVETFARGNGEPGTLSVRHLKRLVAGCGADGKPVGRPRQVTVRLLERIFDRDIGELLAPTPPRNPEYVTDETELRKRLKASARIDAATLQLLNGQLDATRRLDRQLGAPVAHAEVLTKCGQVSALLQYSLMPSNRQRLAELLSELRALAGWQALDTGRISEAWEHYEQGKAAARESGNSGCVARIVAEQGVVLIDLGEAGQAVDLLDSACQQAERTTPALLRSWIAAAQGEALAANGHRSGCLRAFDHATSLLPREQATDCRPYVALDATHLERWRGHALARIGEPAAVGVLSSALERLDPTFTRAEGALRVDLACALATADKHEQARAHLSRARTLAIEVGSMRQRNRASLLERMLKKN